MFSKLVDKIKERKELKQIEKEAYEDEKPIAEAIVYADKVKKARQKGVDKANGEGSSNSSNLLDKIVKFNEKMNNEKQTTKENPKKIETFKFG